MVKTKSLIEMVSQECLQILWKNFQIWKIWNSKPVITDLLKNPQIVEELRQLDILPPLSPPTLFSQHISVAVFSIVLVKILQLAVQRLIWAIDNNYMSLLQHEDPLEGLWTFQKDNSNPWIAVSTITRNSKERPFPPASPSPQEKEKTEKIFIHGKHCFIYPRINCRYYATMAFPELGIKRYQVGYCDGVEDCSLNLVFEKNGPIFKKPAGGIQLSDFLPIESDPDMGSLYYDQ